MSLTVGLYREGVGDDLLEHELAVLVGSTLKLLLDEPRPMLVLRELDNVIGDVCQPPLPRLVVAELLEQRTSRDRRCRVVERSWSSVPVSGHAAVAPEAERPAGEPGPSASETGASLLLLLVNLRLGSSLAVRLAGEATVGGEGWGGEALVVERVGGVGEGREHARLR